MVYLIIYNSIKSFHTESRIVDLSFTHRNTTFTNYFTWNIQAQRHEQVI